MKIRWNHRYVQLGVTAFLVIAASILFYYGIFHMKSLITGIKTFFGIMAPIIYGAAIAYLLTPIVNFLERKIIFPIFEKRNKTLQKKGEESSTLDLCDPFCISYVSGHLCPCHDDPSSIDSKHHEYYLQFSSLCKCSGKLVKFRRGKGMETESGYDQPD